MCTYINTEDIMTTQTAFYGHKSPSYAYQFKSRRCIIVSLSYLFHPLSFETVTLNHLISIIMSHTWYESWLRLLFILFAFAHFDQRCIFFPIFLRFNHGVSNRVRVTQLSRCSSPFLCFKFFAYVHRLTYLMCDYRWNLIG